MRLPSLAALCTLFLLSFAALGSLLVPARSHAELGAIPQRYVYRVDACETVNDHGGWVCRPYGGNVFYDTLASCREVREQSSQSYQKDGFWFQCWRTPTWSPAEERPQEATQ